MQSGADVNSPGYEAITPLHDAVINDHVEVCIVKKSVQATCQELGQRKFGDPLMGIEAV